MNSVARNLSVRVGGAADRASRAIAVKEGASPSARTSGGRYPIRGLDAREIRVLQERVAAGPQVEASPQRNELRDLLEAEFLSRPTNRIHAKAALRAARTSGLEDGRKAMRKELAEALVSLLQPERRRK